MFDPQPEAFAEPPDDHRDAAFEDGAPAPARRSAIPDGLDTLKPGVILAAAVTVVDTERLDAREWLAVLTAANRLISHLHALSYQAMASIAEAHRQELAEAGCDDEELVQRSAAAELSAALQLTRRSAEAELDQAETICDRLPQVLEALEAGDIDRRRAVVLSDETRHLPVEAASRVAEEVLEHAPRLTSGQLRARVRKLAAVADADAAEQRFEQAVDDRRVVAEPTSDGTAHLMILDGSPEQVQRARDRIDRIAKQLRRKGETRSMDQLRADVALDLLSGRHAGAPGGRVELRVDLSTLAGLADRPGELAGLGPVIADIARQTALAVPSWEYVVTDPDTGEVAHTGVTRRRPTAAVARRVRARYQRCVFPGCRMPARSSDLDHRTRYTDGGPTDESNLAPLCRFHHMLRHRGGWDYFPTDDGGFLWVSPLGSTYFSSGRSP